MYDYRIHEILFSDKRARRELEALLTSEKIKLDANLDYTIGLYDENEDLVATGSCFANTLRCLAVDSSHQGEGIMSKVLTHLIDYQMQRGISHLFLYTRIDKSPLFADLGFTEIARAGELVSFMENRRDGFSSYLKELSGTKKDESSAALVMNCNPFTLGHRWLIEKTATENSTAHIFVVSEDASFFPFKDRYELVKAGCADLKNVILHKTGSYMISSAVFPSYFFEDDSSVIKAQAKLDVTLFSKIAWTLGIKARYVGEEPYSKVTRIYNEIMSELLPLAGIRCVIIPRKEMDGEPISASQVRRLLREDRLTEAGALVPATTYDYLRSSAGQEIIKKLKEVQTVTHY